VVLPEECDVMNAFNASSPAHAGCGTFELRFRSLFQEGRALAFTCDADGRIDLDHLSDRSRERYLYARALVGREFAQPEVLPV
jgi:hypothetical protein